MKNKSIATALVGHFCERYDMALYGYFSVMLTPIFFPQAGELALLASLGTFAAGYFMRPFGGLLFGYWGDKYGRKYAFSLSLLLIILPTLLIALLPSYAYLGVLSPIILIICRLTQGFCNGGEFSGAGIFTSEHCPPQQLGFTASLVAGTGILGGAIGSLLGTIFIFFPKIANSWRLPFLMGALLTLVGWFIRRKMSETPVFLKLANAKKTINNPIREVWQTWKLNCIGAGIIAGFGHALLYITTIYMNVYYVKVLHVNHAKAMVITTSILFLWVILSPIMGRLADKFSIHSFMRFSAWLVLIFSYPLFWYFTREPSLYKALTIQILFSFIGAAYVAPISGLFLSFFPSQVRYTGVAFGVTLGQALLGGTAPMIALSLVNFLHDETAPAIFLAIYSVAAIMAIKKFEKNASY